MLFLKVVAGAASESVEDGLGGVSWRFCLTILHLRGREQSRLTRVFGSLAESDEYRRHLSRSHASV